MPRALRVARAPFCFSSSFARLRVGPGDTLYATESPDGVRLTAGDPDFEEKIAVAERIMREDRDILRVLAK